MNKKYNRFSKLAYLKTILIIACWIIFNPILNAQTTAIISGPTTICPNNFHPTGQSGHNYSARAVILGLNANCATWQWFVHKNGVLYEEGFGNNFNYNFPDVGEFTVTFAGASCGIFSGWDIVGHISVNSSVKMPNLVSGPNVTCNPGQEFTYTSNPALDVSDNTCFYHYEYYWKAPAGWSINGVGNTFFGHGNSANIASPANTPHGTYIISVQSTIPNPQLPGPPPNNVFLSLPREYTITVGPFSPVVIPISGAAQVCNGNLYTYTANVPVGHKSGYSYSWTYPSGWIVENITANTIRFYIPLYNTSYGPVRLTMNNGCGSTITGMTVTPGNCNYMTAGNFKIYPNPSDYELNVEYEYSNDLKTDNNFNSKEDNSNKNSLKPEFRVELYDINQNLLNKSESNLGKIQILTNNLPSGTYFLHIYFADEIIRKQINVK